MKFNGVNLILDNFREVLFTYSTDIQDIVRSSILDGVDVSEYVKDCIDDPFRLDQIRLSLKEGVSKTYFSVRGDILYQIRKMLKRGVNLSQVETQLQNGLSDEYIDYLLQWVDDGINLNKLNLGIIPRDLLNVFDYGLRGGFDMSIFNNGCAYTEKYIMLCLQMINNDKSVSFLLEGDWSLNCLGVLCKYSKISKANWGMVASVIDSSISPSRLTSLLNLAKSNILYKELQTKKKGKYVYSDKCLVILYEAFLSNIDVKVLMQETDEVKMEQLRSELELSKKRKVSGRLVRN